MSRRAAFAGGRTSARRPPQGRPGAVRIRPARAADVPPVAAMMAGSPLLRRYGTTIRTARAALAKARAAGDVLIVAGEPGTRLAGMAWVVPSRILTGAAYLRLLLVGEARRGGGIGAALLAAAETAARAVANHLVLVATKDNRGARRFYERHGYRHVGDLPGLARPGLDEALYWKPLRPHGRRLPV